MMSRMHIARLDPLFIARLDPLFFPSFSPSSPLQLEPSITAKNLNLELVLGEDIPKIRFDKDKIVQVITNLVSNAVKFTEKGGITIKSGREENIIHVAVGDTGDGISRENIPNLFQAFQQVGRKRSGGTGLGLAICKKIIESHRGEIWVESEIGKGSQVHFTLPISS